MEAAAPAPLPDDDALASLEERIRRAVERGKIRRADTDESIGNITVSIGVATFPTSAENVFALFDAADLALAQAQSQGRDQACLAPRRAAPALNRVAVCPS